MAKTHSIRTPWLAEHASAAGLVVDLLAHGPGAGQPGLPEPAGDAGQPLWMVGAPGPGLPGIPPGGRPGGSGSGGDGQTGWPNHSPTACTAERWLPLQVSAFMLSRQLQQELCPRLPGTCRGCHRCLRTSTKAGAGATSWMRRSARARPIASPVISPSSQGLNDWSNRIMLFIPAPQSLSAGCPCRGWRCTRQPRPGGPPRSTGCPCPGPS